MKKHTAERCFESAVRLPELRQQDNTLPEAYLMLSIRKLLLIRAALLLGATMPFAPAALAQPCLTNSFTVFNGGSLTCTTQGDTGQVTVQIGATLNMTVRNGDTVGSGRPYSIYSGGSTSVVNNGVFGNGVGVADGTTTLTNNGPINSSGFGIIVTGGSLNLINNANGSIEAASSGILTNSSGNHEITNYGRIAAAANGIGLQNGQLVVNQHGVISQGVNGMAGIFVAGALSRLTLNIYNGSRFEGGVGLMMNNSSFTGSTINFYAPNYSLTVQNFLRANHTVTAQSPGSIVTFTGADTANGNGTLVVSTPAPAPAAATPTVAQASATAVQSALQVSPVQAGLPPLQSTLPDVGQSTGGGNGAFGGGTDSGTGMSNLGMNLRGTQTDDIPTGNGQSVDRHGNLAWARGFGAARFQPSSDGVAGNVNRTVGVLFGYDRRFSTWRLGAYGGYGLSNTALTDNSAKLQSQLYLAGLYGQTKLAATTFTFNLAGGILGNTTTRFINNAAEAANASFRGAFFAPDAAVAYDMAIARGWTLTPALRARYIATVTNDYAETGSTQNIAYQSAFSSSFEERAELRLTHKQPMPTGGTLSSYVQAAAIASQRIGSGAVSATLLGTEIAVPSASAGTVTGLSLGAGVDMALAPNIATYAGIDATEYSDATKALTGRVGLRIGF